MKLHPGSLFHQLANIKYTIILFVCPPKILHKHCFIFSWDLRCSHEKLETMLMQNFGWTNKECYGIFDIGQLKYQHSDRTPILYEWNLAPRTRKFIGHDEQHLLHKSCKTVEIIHERETLIKHEEFGDHGEEQKRNFVDFAYCVGR